MSGFRIRIRVMVFNATFNTISAISWRWVLLVDDTGVQTRCHLVFEVYSRF